MKEPRSVLETLRSRGSELFGQVSADLMRSPQFVKALQAALRGKAVLDQAAGRALRNMNMPTRAEFERAQRRIEALEQELAALRSAARSRKPQPRRKKQ